MGYEVKMYVGTVSNIPSEEDRIKYDNGKYYFRVIGMVDLCKTGNFGSDSYMKKGVKYKSVYIYGTDGNTKIERDWYDAELFAIPAKDVLATLKKANKQEPYRRYQIAIGFLEPIIKTFKNEDPHVFFYGH